MKPGRRRRAWRSAWRWGFAACALLLFAALYGFTLVVLRAERAGIAARAEAEYRETLRLALWRMEARITPLLAREAARPYFEYRSYHRPGKPHEAFPRAGGPEDGWVPSPLLGVAAAPIRLHFQLGPDGRLTSPQVPATRSGPGLSLASFRANRRILRKLDREIAQDRFREDVAAAEEIASSYMEAPRAGDDGAPGEATPDAGGEFAARARALVRAVSQGEGRPAAGGASTRTVTEIGPLVPLWISDPTGDEADLAYVRRVDLRDGKYLQGFVVDWERLRADLLETVADLLPEAELIPAPRAEPATGRGHRLLAGAPAVLELAWTTQRPGGVVTPSRVALAGVWLVTCGALAVAGIALRSRLRHTGR